MAKSVTQHWVVVFFRWKTLFLTNQHNKLNFTALHRVISMVKFECMSQNFNLSISQDLTDCIGPALRWHFLLISAL